MDIEAVVREICAGCASKGYRVSEILAAFIARTVLESNPNEFSLDSSLSNSDVNKLIDYSIQVRMARVARVARVVVVVVVLVWWCGVVCRRW